MTALPRTMTPAEKVFFRAVGARIAAFRNDAGLTQVQLADAIGVTQPQLASYEIGRRRVPLSLMPELARALGVSVDDLLGEDGRPAKRGPASRIEQQVELIRRLPRSKQQLVIQMIDAILHQAAAESRA